MRPLTNEEIALFKSKLVKNGVPVRFLFNGQACEIETGRMCSKGSNVIYHPVYWNFDKETAKEIAKLTGTKAVFSK